MTKGTSITEQDCLFKNRKFSHEMSKQDVQWQLKAFKQACSDVKAALKDLKIAVEQADHSQRDTLIEWLLTSECAKRYGVMQYAIHRKVAERPSLDACIACVETVDLTAPIEEVAKVYPKEKPGKSEFRPIAVFDIQHRTAQAMVKAVLDVLFKPRKFQFSHRGVAPAIAEARKQIGKGRHYYAHLDIKSYYMKFVASKLAANSPLPAWAVEHVLVGENMQWEARGMKMLFPHSNTRIIDQARLGIPQGSSASPIVAMIECARLTPSSLGITALMNYMDDFLLLAKTGKDLEEQIAKLSEAVGALPSGHFTLVTKSKGHLADGCDFLGHHLKLEDKDLRVKPTEANVQKLFHKLNEMEEASEAHTTSNPDKAKIIQAAAEMNAHIEGWKSAFQECDDLEDRWLMLPRQNVEHMLAKAGATLDDLKGLAPKVTYYPWYQEKAWETNEAD